MARDPKIPPTSADVAAARERLAASGAVESMDKKVEAQERRTAQAEEASAKARKANTGTRTEATGAIDRQVRSLSALEGALARENDLLKANTALWRANVGARGGSTGAATTAAQGETSALQATRARAQAVEDLERKAARLGATEDAAALATLRRLSAAGVPQQQAERLALSRGAAAPLALPAGPAPFVGGTPVGDIYNMRLREEAARTAAIRLGEQGARGVFVGGPEGVYQAATRRRTYETPGGISKTETAIMGEYTASEKEAIRAGEQMLGSEGRIAQAVANTNAAWRQSVAEVGAASQALTRHGALTAEFIQSLVRGEATLKEFGSQLTITIGKFAGWAVAGGLVYAAFEALKHVIRGATDTATQVTQLERVQFPGGFDRRAAEAGLRGLSRHLNIPIAEAGEAQFFAARAGFNRSQKESLEAADVVAKAKVLDLVPIQDAARGLGATRAAFNLNAAAIKHVFDELDVGQLKFNARVQQTLPYLGRAAASWEQGGGSVQGLTRQIIALTGVIPGGGGGGGSGSAATFFTRFAGNIRRPQAFSFFERYGFPTENPEAIMLALQHAARTGVTPSGAPFTRDVRAEAATIAGGGPAMGTRYAIAAIEAGRLEPGGKSRIQEIYEATAHGKAAGAAQEDLNHKLEQFNEKVKRLGVDLESIGSLFTTTGFTRIGADLLNVVDLLARGFEFLLKPLAGLGELLSRIPGPIETAGVALAGLAVAARIGQTRAAQGAGRMFGEAVPGFMQGPEAPALREARRTYGENQRLYKDRVERAVRAEEERAAEANEAALARQRFVRGQPQFATDAERKRYLASERGMAATGRAAELQQAEGNALERYNAAKEATIAVQQRLLLIDEVLEVLADNSLNKQQKLLALREKEAAVAKVSSGLIVTATEPAGTKREAQKRLEEEGLLTRGAPKVAGGEEATVKAGQATAAVLAKTSRDTEEGGNELSRAFSGSATRAKTGLQQFLDNTMLSAPVRRIGPAFGSAMRPFTDVLSSGTGRVRIALQEFVESVMQSAIGVRAAGVARGARDVVAGGAGMVGALGRSIAQGGMQALFYAYMGQMAGELGGQALTALTGSKRAGGVLAGIGTGAGVGAGVGALIAPLVGPEAIPIGGLIGAIGGGAISLFGGGKGKTQQEKLEERGRKRAERAMEEGATLNAATIAGAQEEFTAAVGESLTKEGEAATKAKEKAQSVIEGFAVDAKTLAGTARGEEAAKALGQTVAGYARAIGEAPAGPKRLEALKSLDDAQQLAGKQASEMLKVNEAFAKTPAEHAAALKQAMAPLAAEATGYTKEEQGLAYRLQQQKKQQQKLFKEEQKAIKALKDEGFGTQEAVEQYEASDLYKNVEKNRKAIETTENAKKEMSDRRGAFEKQRVLQEVELSESDMKERQKERDTLAALQSARVVEPGEKRAIAQRKREAERGELRAELVEARKEEPKLRGAAEKKVRERQEELTKEEVEEQRSARKERVERIEAAGKLQLAQIPSYEKPRRLQLEQTNAERVLQYMRGHRGDFDWKELMAAQERVDLAKMAVAENLREEGRKARDMESEIQKARAEGSPVVQAGYDIASALRHGREARTPEQRREAVREMVNAQNERHKALVDRARQETALAESETTDPVTQALDKLRGAYRNLSMARGEETIGAQAEVNRARQDYAKALVSRAEKDIDFQLQMEKISKETAISRLKALLKTHKLGREEEQEILLRIHNLQKAATGEGLTFRLAPGNIKMPTTYDVQKALRETDAIYRRTVAARHHAVPSGAELQAHRTSISNTNHITINVHHAGHAAEVGDHVERITGASLRARRRAAGVR